MKTVTDQIESQSGGLLKAVPEYGEHPGYLMFNDGGIECQTGELLFGLVRLIRPMVVLETGTHLGVGASYLATALQCNGKGKVTTLEFLPENHAAANKLFAQLGLTSYVESKLMDAANYLPTSLIDFLFLDTEPQTRFAELIKFYPHVRPGGLIGIHDLHPHMHQVPNLEHGFAWPYGPIPGEFRALVLQGKLRPVHFRTPRGLTMFYKPSQDDYDWGYSAEEDSFGPNG